MPRPIEISTGLAAVGLAVLVPTAAGDFRWGWALVVGAIAYLALVYATSRILEDRRQSRDRLMRATLLMAFLAVMVPLISVAWTVVREGASRLDATFLTGTGRRAPAALLAPREGGPAGGAVR
ncbi:MAG: hypothetical protein VW708_05895, partial [Ilumatobacter sp.]